MKSQITVAAALLLGIGPVWAGNALLPEFDDPVFQQHRQQFLADYRRYLENPDLFFDPEKDGKCLPTPELVQSASGVEAKNASGAAHGMEYAISDLSVTILNASCPDGYAREGNVRYRVSYREETLMHKSRQKSTMDHEYVFDTVFRAGMPTGTRAMYMRLGNLVSEQRLASGEVVKVLSPEQVRELRERKNVGFYYSDPGIPQDSADYYRLGFAFDVKGSQVLQTMLTRNLPDGGSSTMNWMDGKPFLFSRFDADNRTHGEVIQYAWDYGGTRTPEKRSCFRHGEPVKTLNCNVDEE